jgi:hypothetical protein
MNQGACKNKYKKYKFRFNRLKPEEKDTKRDKKERKKERKKGRKKK